MSQNIVRLCADLYFHFFFGLLLMVVGLIAIGSRVIARYLFHIFLFFLFFFLISHLILTTILRDDKRSGTWPRPLFFLALFTCSDNSQQETTAECTVITSANDPRKRTASHAIEYTLNSSPSLCIVHRRLGHAPAAICPSAQLLFPFLLLPPPFPPPFPCQSILPASLRLVASEITSSTRSGRIDLGRQIDLNKICDIRS